MDCIACGIRLPDDANFCMSCGQAQQVEVWEVCRVELFSTEGDQNLTGRKRPYVLRAIATDPTGATRPVGESSEFIMGTWVSNSDALVRRALDELAAKLRADN